MLFCVTHMKMQHMNFREKRHMQFKTINHLGMDYFPHLKVKLLSDIFFNVKDEEIMK